MSRKLVLSSISDTSFILDDVELQSYPTTVLNERTRHFRGSKHTLTHPTYFQGSRPPNPRIYTPYDDDVFDAVR